MILRDTLVYGNGSVQSVTPDLSGVVALGLTRDRWIQYQHDLRDLNLYGVLKGDSSIEFRVDPGHTANGDSYKGYWHTTIRPAHIRPSLDAYQIADKDKDQNGDYIAFKELDGNWYLYLFVNR